MDEFGPLNFLPHPGRQRTERGGKGKDPGREPRPRRRATYTRPHGVPHLCAAYDLGKDQRHGHIKKTKNRSKFLESCRYLRSLHQADEDNMFRRYIIWRNKNAADKRLTALGRRANAA
ncbi:hypothetical protein OG718_05730 [Streptomyces sp. NBC_00258]